MNKCRVKHEEIAGTLTQMEQEDLAHEGGGARFIYTGG